MYTFLMFWKLFYSIFQTAGSGRSLCSYPEWLHVPFAKDRYKSLCFILIVPLTPAVSENHLIDSPEEWDISFIHIRKNYSCSCSEVSYTPAGEDPRGKYFDRVKKVLFIIHLIYSDLLKVVSRAVVLASGYWIKDLIHFSCFLFFFCCRSMKKSIWQEPVAITNSQGGVWTNGWRRKHIQSFLQGLSNLYLALLRI